MTTKKRKDQIRIHISAHDGESALHAAQKVEDFYYALCADLKKAKASK